MSKGKTLGKLLEEGEKVHRQMDGLFLKNGLSKRDLKELPEPDKTEWYRLKSVADELSKQMCKTING
jgi:hypothetical protein